MKRFTRLAQDFVQRTATRAKGLLVLARSRVLTPHRPDRLIKAGQALAKYEYSVGAGYASGAALRPDHPAIIDELGTLTWAEVDDRTTRLAHGFAQQGVRPGSFVGVLCRNHRGFVESMAALSKLGAHTVLLNTGASPSQTGAVLREQEICLVVADTEFRPLLVNAPRGLKRVTAWTDGPTKSTTLEQLIASFPAAELPKPPISRMIVLTSGTTGTPRGARRPHATGLLGSAAPFLSRIPLRGGEPMFIPAPMFHSWGIGAFQISLVLGSPIVLRRKFEPESALATVQKHRCTSMFAVPVMLQRIMELPLEERRRHDTSFLRTVACTGSVLPGKLATEFLDAFGPVLYNFYGSTEASWISVASPEELRIAPGTAGKPPLGTRLEILDDDGRPVPRGRTGRIFVANEMLFDGYTNGSGKQVVDGMLSTGDVGYLDRHGLLFVAGRDDDMIISGGENLYPREVEDVLAALPEVREVAVVGVPDEEFGQRLAAYVVPAQGALLDAEELRGHVRATLTRFCVPRDVTFLDALPRNAAGKVVKRELG
ncbi:AMP-binding protein [Allokutzneria sp. A3M-2-11 16]|uniref:AMP-binding protein n=1 Tax=Allokutzneria sp. A3M-2-11 16 TaxID=2962043 RepID=UPI0020B6A601|nr:AMP-binding protein [Allokutzneria sp. A3M-2-11 16]MCP3800807.1 AMP-binding protein [Allokutzneria sp. A3M-2-11 16]